MALTNDDKFRIAEKVLAFVKSVTVSKNRIITPHYKGRIIRTKTELRRLALRLMNLQEFAFDTEFTSLRMQWKGEQDFVGCSFSWGKTHNYYVPVGHIVDDEQDQIDEDDFVEIMQRVFARKDVRLIGHNLKAELHALANIGIDVATNDFFDTLMAVWNLDENNANDLKSIAKNYYGYDQTHFKDLLYTVPKEVRNEFEITKEKDINASHVSIRVMAPYAMDDTYWTWKVYLDCQDAMADEGAEAYFYKRQMPYLRVLFNMERRGVPVNKKRLLKMSEMANKDLEDLEYRIYEIAGIEFNIGSGDQLAEILYGYEKEKPIYHINYEPILDPKTGEQAVYKSGARKGELKWKEIKDKNRIVGYEKAGNKHILEASFGFPITKTTDSGSPSTDAKALEELAKKKYKRDKRKAEGLEMVKLILRYKKLDKLKGTYMDGLLREVYSDGKIHCSFNQTGTTSGRLSCSSPNLQNLPRPVEKVDDTPPPKEKFDSKEEFQKAYDSWKFEYDEYKFWARYEIRDALEVGNEEEEVLIAADYSNLELRVLTHFCQDPLLISMFARNADVHGQTAIDMYKLPCTDKEAKKLYPHYRQQAKVLNFLLIYGGSPLALASSLGVSKQEGQALYDLYFDTYKNVTKFMASQKRYGHRHLYVLTLLGRRRHLEGINASDWGTKGYYERLSVNSPIQGSAADIAISAQILLENDEELKQLGYRQLLQVHDEVVGVCPKKNKEKVAARKQYLMENCLPKPLNNIKLKVDYDFGKTYAEAK